MAASIIQARISVPGVQPKLSLHLDRKKAKIRRSDFEAFGQNIGLTETQIQKALKRIGAVGKKTLDERLARSFLTEDMKAAFCALFERRVARLLG